MSTRRPASLLVATAMTAAMISLGPPASAHRAAPPQGSRPAVRVSRADVLAGRATDAQERALFRDTLSRVDGVTLLADGSEAPTPVGGWTEPDLAVDLDGDGDQEVLAEQWSQDEYGDEELSVVALDDQGVLWRQFVPSDTWIEGMLTGNFASSAGTEVLIVGEHYSHSGSDTILALTGSSGLLWAKQIGTTWLELNGPVRADDDAQSELAYTTWNNKAVPTVVTLDGDTGDRISALTATFKRVTSSGNAFVTDTPGAASDEAVFVAALPTDYASPGYYAETVSLSDGTVLERHPEPLGATLSLSQGPDYTGDGRRDAYAGGYDVMGNGLYGVFDPATLKLAWSKQPPEGPFGFGGPGYSPTFDAGDLDGDHGAEVCFTSQSWADTTVETVTFEAQCQSGKTGADIWKATRTATAPSENGYADAYGYPDVDVDGDGAGDIIVSTGSGDCVYDPDQDDYTCTGNWHDEAISSRNGSTLWTDPSNVDYWDYSASDLDGTPGADVFELTAASTEDGDLASPAIFDVLNGLTFAKRWGATIPTGGFPGYPIGAVSANIDGQGQNEVVTTAIGEEKECTPSGKHCWYTEHAYVAGFSNRHLAWNYEL
ncbi:MAG: hypothetical protein ABR600_06350 [Actinomycetota bacterium]